MNSKSWYIDIRRILNKCQKMGLLDKTQEGGGRCDIIATGNKENLRMLHLLIYNFKSCHLRHYSRSSWEFEKITLDIIQNDARLSKENFKILFMHIGIFEVENTSDADFISFMYYFLINRWSLAMKILNVSDVCGVNYTKKPIPHFYGNFWWANSKYIKTLPTYINYKYPERWLCLRLDKKLISMAQSCVNHRTDKYPRCEYNNKTMIHMLGYKQEEVIPVLNYLGIKDI